MRNRFPIAPASATLEADLVSDIYYQCQRCTNCCKWPGFVKLTDGDISAISEFLGMDETTFIQDFTRLRPRRDGLALIDKPNGECIFLDGPDCRVQKVKLFQCTGFPNTWNFPGWRDVCEAIPIIREKASPPGCNTPNLSA